MNKEDPKPDTEQLPAVRLKAMTLHGIGSYVDGARLEFKPLTILCGTNGPGKSTWMNTLHLLRESLEQGLLPFRVGYWNHSEEPS